MSIALLGSGAFGVPTFEAIRLHQEEMGVRISCVVSQPDRPAGRGRSSQPTPVSQWAMAHGLMLHRFEDANGEDALKAIGVSGVDLFVVIAFGQKLSSEFLGTTQAINLHGSVLPAWRGAAPIQRSLMAGGVGVGVSVIEVASRMDAGGILASAAAEVGASETAGELHDRLAQTGCQIMIELIARIAAAGSMRIHAAAQDESCATRARKLSRADAWVDFNQDASMVRARINGLSPWPGVDAVVGARPLKLLRAVEVDTANGSGITGLVSPNGVVRCARGAVQLLEVQEPGAKAMAWSDFARGRRMTNPEAIFCATATGDGSTVKP